MIGGSLEAFDACLRAEIGIAPTGVKLFVKIEAFNPLGSVKDRLAPGVVEAAELRA